MKKFFINNRYYIYTLLSIPFWFILANKIFYDSEQGMSSLAGKDISLGNILLKGWSIGNDSFFTTDYLWHGLLACFVKNVLMEAHVFSCIIVFLLYLSIRRLIIAVQDDCSDLRVRGSFHNCEELIFFVISLILLSLSKFILLTYGRGMTIVFCIFSVLYLIKYNANSRNAAFCFVFSILALSGDSYSFIYFFVPCFITVCLRFIHLSCARKLLLLSIIFITSLLLRFILQKYGFENPYSITKVNFVEFDKFFDNIYRVFGCLFDVTNSWFWGLSPKNPHIIIPLFFLGINLILLASSFCPIKNHSRVRYFLILSSLMLLASCIFSNIPQWSKFYCSHFFTGLIINLIPLFFISPFFLFIILKINIFHKYIIIIITFLFISTYVLTYHKSDRIDALTELSTYLLSKKLTHGFGDFWTSNAVKLISNLKVNLDCISYDNNKFYPRYWMSNNNSYKYPANYLIIDENDKHVGYSEKELLGVFGTPAKVYQFKSYKIYSYEYPINDKLSFRIKDLSISKNNVNFIPAKFFHIYDCTKNGDTYEIICKSNIKEYIISGPYIRIPKGVWRITYKLRAKNVTQLHHAMIMFDCVNEDFKIFFKKIYKLDKLNTDPSFVFCSDNSIYEFRVFLDGNLEGSSFYFDGIYLEYQNNTDIK